MKKEVHTGIDRSTGQLYVTDDTLDYEQLGSSNTIALRIRATDSQGNYGEINKNIIVVNRNEPPSIRAQTEAQLIQFTIKEDFTSTSTDPISGQKGVIGSQIIVQDTDGDDDVDNVATQNIYMSINDDIKCYFSRLISCQ